MPNSNIRGTTMSVNFNTDFYLEQISNDAVIGDLEYRRLGVFVDGYDYFAVFHSGQMLNGARNANGNVELLQILTTEIHQ